jgi:hypothetical protein
MRIQEVKNWKKVTLDRDEWAEVLKNSRAHQGAVEPMMMKSQYNKNIKIGLFTCVTKNRLDAQLILSIFRQPLHVSGISTPIIRRYNRMYTAFGTYYSF